MKEYLLAFPYEPKWGIATEDDYLHRVKSGDELTIGKLAEVLDTIENPYYYKYFQHHALKSVPFDEVERLGRPETGTTLYDIHGTAYEFVDYVTVHDDDDGWVTVASLNNGESRPLKPLYDLYPANPAVVKQEHFFTHCGSTPHDSGSWADLYHTDLPMEKAIGKLAKPYKSLTVGNLPDGYALFVVYDSRE